MWSAKPGVLPLPDLATELKRANDRADMERWQRQRDEIRRDEIAIIRRLMSEPMGKRDAQSAREHEQTFQRTGAGDQAS